MVLSEAWPGERTIRIGRPQPSTRTCSLVVNPPRERPMARLAQGVRGALCEVAAVAPPDRLLDRARPPTRRRRKKGGEDHALIEPLLPGADGSRNGRPRLDDRKVLNGILLHFAHRLALARPAGAVRAVHDGVQPLQPLGKTFRPGATSSPIAATTPKRSSA